MQPLPVRLFFLLGGFFGFWLTFLLVLVSGGGPTVALRDGAIACLITAYVFKLLVHYINASLEPPQQAQPSPSSAASTPQV